MAAKAAAAEKNVVTEEKVPGDVWIGRLADLLKIVEAMKKDEREAAFAFLKSRYHSEWPSSDY